MNTIGHANTFPSVPPLTAVNGGAVARPVIAGCEIFECLGRGGCASVYEARHPVHGEVAIKISEAPRASAVDAEQRLEREALLMQRVAHENVLRVFDIGHTDDGAPYLVMERLRGEDLETLLERVGRLPISVACELAVQTLSGLEAVHAAGIVHRDLKPNNIVLHAPDEWGAPIVKLIDFGIARGDDAAKLTRTGMVIGTPQYLSPEQAQGKPVDARADVWASGILLFELIVGEGPFEGTSLQETLASILFADVPSIRERRPDVPDAIADVIDRALERDLTRRFASAKEMREALAVAVAKSSVPCGAQTLFAVSVLPKKTLSPWKSMLESEPSGVRARPIAEARTVPLTATTKRRRGLVVLAVAVLAILAGGFSYASSARTEEQGPRSTVVSERSQPSAQIEQPPPRASSEVRAPSVAGSLAMTATVVPRAAVPVASQRRIAHDPALTPDMRRARSLSARGRVALARGRSEEAYRLFDEATGLDPDLATAWHGFGLAAYQRGNMGEARRALRRYRALAD